MTIRRRHAPTDFGASNDEVAAVPKEAAAQPALVDPAADAADGGALTAGSTDLARSASRAPTSPRQRRGVENSAAASSGWPIYLAALAISVLWALAPIAFALGYRQNIAPLTHDRFALIVFALLAIGPAILVWGAAYMIRQSQKLAAESRRTQAMAEEMLAPALAAGARTGDVVQSIREEIVAAGAAADQAREALTALRQAIAAEAQALAEGTQVSVRTAQDLAGALGRERSEMGQLSATLDAQAARVADTIGRQAQMVSEAAQMADAQLREAEATLSARAADLAAAAGEAGDAARIAGEDLVRHIARLETAGTGVAEQVKAVEGGLSEQRTALMTLSQALRSDHEGFAAEADAHAAKLSDFISQARLSAAEMSDRAAKGGEALKSLMADAALQFRDLAETARAEREEFGQSTLQSLDAVAQAAAQERAQLEAQTRAAIEALHAAAEETREAAARHAVTARDQIDQLSEAAFSAGQKANEVFEKRLEEARALVEQSSRMVEDAGAETAKRLDEGAAAARETLKGLEAMLAELEARASRMPQEARGHVDEVRATVEDGMQALMDAARRTAEEAQAIDAAFQERVRRNFEMLSEAVRLMGTVAAAPPTPAASPLPPARSSAQATFTSAYTPPPRPTAAVSEPLPEPPPPVSADDEGDLDLEDLIEPAAPAEPAPQAPAERPLTQRLGLRPRLRLTPTATDEEFSQVFEAAGGVQPAEAKPKGDAEGWGWKDLLASIDVSGAEAARLEEKLAEELGEMGVEPATLLPKPRIEAVAAAVQTGDFEGARKVVRKLAPAATRRIQRRLGGDEALKGQVAAFLRRQQALIADAVVRDPQGFAVAEMLSSPGGRIYLLFDAAAGDMA